MSPGKRISKKQIKEDKLVSTVFRANEYIQKNRTPFIVGGSVVAVIFIGIVLFLWNADRERTEAANLLSRAYLSWDAGQADAAINDLERIISDYSETPSARPACFMLANLFYLQKNYNDALMFYNLVLSKYNQDKMMAAGAAAGAAACNDINGDRLEAGRLLRMAADLYPDEMWAPGYLLRAGADFLAVGDTASGMAAYEEIIERYSSSMEANAAKRSLAEIAY